MQLTVAVFIEKTEGFSELNNLLICENFRHGGDGGWFDDIWNKKLWLARKILREKGEKKIKERERDVFGVCTSCCLLSIAQA